MLGMKEYPQSYIDECRARVDRDLKALGKLPPAARSAIEDPYLTNVLLAMQHAFEHRLRTVEGKDGNPLNEVRILTNSILLHDGKLTIDNPPGFMAAYNKALKLDPATSVLGLKPGDKVRLDEAGVRKLSKAFFEELEAKFT